VAVADRCQCGARKVEAAPADDGARGILDWVADLIGPRSRRNDR